MEKAKHYAIESSYLVIGPDNDVHVTPDGKLVYIAVVFLLLVATYIINSTCFYLFSENYR